MNPVVLTEEWGRRSRVGNGWGCLGSTPELLSLRRCCCCSRWNSFCCCRCSCGRPGGGDCRLPGCRELSNEVSSLLECQRELLELTELAKESKELWSWSGSLRLELLVCVRPSNSPVDFPLIQSEYVGSKGMCGGRSPLDSFVGLRRITPRSPDQPALLPPAGFRTAAWRRA